MVSKIRFRQNTNSKIEFVFFVEWVNSFFEAICSYILIWRQKRICCREWENEIERCFTFSDLLNPGSRSCFLPPEKMSIVFERIPERCRSTAYNFTWGEHCTNLQVFITSPLTFEYLLRCLSEVSTTSYFENLLCRHVEGLRSTWHFRVEIVISKNFENSLNKISFV